MHFHVITLFPGLVESYLGESILARAIKNKKIKVDFYNPRDFVRPTKKQKGKSKPYLRVDDKPYGGGPGMVMQAEPILKAVEAALRKVNRGKRIVDSKIQKTKSRKLTTHHSPLATKIIFFEPRAKRFDTVYAKTAAKKYSDIILICGRYEGIDARAKKILRAEGLSVGDYVLTGGEIPAMIIIDSISRQIEGVLGNFDSREEERIASSEVYTRPEVLKYKKKNYKVPKVLLSGHHMKIDRWRLDS